jgi:peptidoglycan/xylan/chitin deacetylase (PgdA/CDA1 family)
MFFHQDIKGDGLPRGTVCFTYDDGPGVTAGKGPGPNTLELGRFLFEEQVPATFFVIGSHAEQHRDVLAQLRDWGHLVGNHTYSHPGLVSLALAGGDVIGELRKTDAIIRPYVSGEVVFFRAPYGNWREKVHPDSDQDKTTSLVADILNRSGKFADYVGPVNWDIVAKDWACWRQGISAKECARRYLEETERIGSGIILMHDSSEEEVIRRRNRTMQMTKILVPLLKKRGYRFIRLDAVPQVQDAVRTCRAKTTTPRP